MNRVFALLVVSVIAAVSTVVSAATPTMTSTRAALSAATPTNAATHVPTPPTQFDKLVTMFNGGRAATLADFPKNLWKTGRCIAAAQPAVPQPASIMKFHPTGLGPAFPDLERIAVKFALGDKPDKFDAYMPQLAKEWADYLTTSETYWTDPYTDMGSLVTMMTQPQQGAGGYEIDYRFAAPYFVASLVKCAVAAGCDLGGPDIPLYKEGETIFACYYFKDVL